MNKNTKSFVLVFSGFTAIFLALSVFCFILAPKDIKGLESAPAFPVSYEPDETSAIASMREKNVLEPDFKTAVTDFSYKTASQFLSGNKENVTYSPLSLYYALALVGTGAKGETQSEIYDILGAKSTKTLSDQASNLYRLLYSDNSITKTRIANSLWLDKSVSLNEKTKQGRPLEFKEKFMSNSKVNLYSTLFSVDYKDKETALSMQRWIKQYTNGAIDKPVELAENTLLTILNTVHFSDEWSTAFAVEDTRPGDFMLADGSNVATNYMNKKFSSHPFYKGENFTRSAVSLKGGNEMAFIMPDENTDINSLLSSPENTAALFGGENKIGEVDFQIPKFSYDSSLDLSSALQTLGINAAFSDGADFTDMTNKPVKLSTVNQNSHISIDEKGAQATSVTKIEMAPTSAPPSGNSAAMILNRPFIYAIMSQDGFPLFIGVCQNPAA